MIANVPSAEDLQTISLRLYFKAWADTVELVAEFHDINLTGPLLSEAELGDWEDYLQGAQSDLQGLYSLLQQSQEIGLKALIAEVSPFLLLKRYDVKSSPDGSYDFSDFPTLDASELVRVHDVFCGRQISTAFGAAYETLRKGRNKIAHLGVFTERLDPMALIELMLLQYGELYPGRRWLPDRYRLATLHRWAHLESSDWTSRTSVLNELWRVIPWLRPAEFKVVMRQSPDRVRFICPFCALDLRTGNEPYPADVPTAYLDEDYGHVNCELCLGNYALEQRPCSESHCKNQLFPVPDGRFDPLCLACGADPDLS